ncbi:MAG: ABC transporter ATP-binding protein [bacterium]|jgi:branched-chain amino acid transport system ATP-binding protein|nr:ABC transporter ATP-binding protein [Phycisphaerales bacterium]MCE2654153.1 ABC transporter ATP-binding protein [Planctomycetaceae bacterium]
MALLKVANLCVHYGAIQGIADVSFSVEQGEILTLIGSNGAGKSTTLRAVSGMVRPSSGSVEFKGRSIVGLQPHQIVKAGISHAPEGRGIFSNLTVAENLRLGAYIRHDSAAIADDTEKVLTTFPRLKERMWQNAGTLSGGEQQMLAIGRALLARPQILLLDEPSLGLAPQLVQTIFSVIREINRQGTTILLVEQNAHMALGVAHHAVVLEVGRVAMAGKASDLAASDAVKKAYLGHG